MSTLLSLSGVSYFCGRRQAGNEVNKAIRRGHLQKATDFQCVDCGAPAKEWEHRDYNFPMLVEPTCVRCNRIRHKAIWLGDSEILKTVDTSAYKIWSAVRDATSLAIGCVDRGEFLRILRYPSSFPNERFFSWFMQVPNVDLCFVFERATGGQVTCEALRPDIDWNYVRSARETEPANA